ncbi:MAG: peroxiredoxin family protein [Chloroflexi bacterium]|jgi:peroxiredoxin|nr:peroxiredoxin family protein [Chloroflexota bacterium]GIW09884.1 MAG: hypothetical protein KatS3mg061_0941 [Dehalococcoidia bacterium]
MHPDLQVGKRFPDFAAPDHTGAVRRLSEFAGKDPLALIIYRGWW